MATPMNFQTLNFGNIPQQEAEARRRYYDSLGSIGGVVANTGTKVDDYLQRKQREAEDKKKWDNMIAEQEYRKQQDRLAREYQARRDSITDARYENEWNEKQAELRRAETSRMNERESLENYQAGMHGAYTPEFLQKYGPRAQALYAAAIGSKTYADAVARGNELLQVIQNQDVIEEQRRQADLENMPNHVVNQVMSNLSRGGVDLRGNSVPQKLNEDGTAYVPDSEAITKQIALIDQELERLNINGDNSSSSETRQALVNKRAALEMALHPTAKRTYVPGWNNFGSYTK